MAITFATVVTDLSNVVKELLNSSAVTPNTKAALATTLDNAVANSKTLGATLATGAETVIADAPAEAGALAETAVEKVSALGGPVTAVVGSVAAPVVAEIATSEVSKLIAVIEAHNKVLMTDLQNLASGGTVN